ncbi:MAG: hypothetical protein GX770_05465 [Firmicutes bacterium]|nr:hypothetical protein [Bacillota bacterium]
MREANQEEQLTGPQGRVLKLILSWLQEHDSSEDKYQQAKAIWLHYLKLVDPTRSTFANTRLWAAAVLYTLGLQGGYQTMTGPKLAMAFGVSMTSIHNRGTEILRTLAGAEQPRDNLVKMHRFFPSEDAAKAFHELIVFTQRSEEWMNYVATVFEEFILWEKTALSFDLLLELLLFTTCDRVLPEGKSIITFYLERKHDLGGEERNFLERLQASRFGLFQVKSAEKEGAVRFKDLFRGDEVPVAMGGIIAPSGRFMMGRIMPGSSGKGKPWRPVVFLTALEAPMVAALEAEAKKWFWQYSVAHKGWATEEDFIRENGYRFLRWYLDHDTGRT